MYVVGVGVGRRGLLFQIFFFWGGWWWLGIGSNFKLGAAQIVLLKWKSVVVVFLIQDVSLKIEELKKEEDRLLRKGQLQDEADKKL